MAYAPFVPLRVFSAYTMLEGAIDPKAIGKHAKNLGFPAAAICDRNGLYGVMQFEPGCRDNGVQPIIGALLCVARPDDIGGGDALDWLALYAQDEGGWNNLCALVSAAHLDRPVSEPAHVPLAAIEGRSEGLIALTAGAEGALARLCAAGQGGAADAYAGRLAALFGDRLYIELSRRNDPVETAAEEALVDLAYARGLPLVATNPACYAEPVFHAAHDAMLCIAGGEYVESDDRRAKSSPDAWLKTGRDMKERFADLPEAVANTLVVAQRCTASAPRRKPILPSLAGDRAGEEAMLREQARAGLLKRLRAKDSARLKQAEAGGAGATGGRPLDGLGTGSARGERPGGLDGTGEAGTPPAPFVSSEVETHCETAAPDDAALEARYPTYFERLRFECDVIIGMGFPGYFLIVADFIRWAKDNGIPVGPGRGSGAGSLVAWSLLITDLDPIELGLLFERFLNPERVSMPDFDIDFCETRREQVIRYVQGKYGHDHVAQIITFGKLKARAVLRDTGRVLQMGYGQVDRLCKLVPNHPTDPWDLDRAMKGVAELRQEIDRDPQVKRLFTLARQLEGLPRHSSTHAAGVVIGDRPLDRLVPLYRDPRSDMPVTQFDMKYVENTGLVKFDFLGLKTLSVLDKAVAMLRKRGIFIDLSALPLDDEATYRLLQRGDTVGVFQLESEGMRRTLAAVKPTGFGDIIALVSLYRPGPMDNIPLFGARKNGQQPIEYPHALLEPILAETYGIFVYQEQVMQAAQILAGYSLGEADLLRRAMGKKVKAEMDAQRGRFVAGCAEKAIAPGHANELFDLIDKFAGYGFNKSHAAAYALLAYQTGWLKAHHPHEFFAASMCFDMHQTDKLAIFMDDMCRSKVRVLPPCVNASAADYSVEENGEGLAVRYALAGLKNVGEKAMEGLAEERRANGPFASLDDFAHRVDSAAVNKRSLEMLAAAGAFDGLEPNRAAVLAGCDTIIAAASSARLTRESGQGGLFGGPDTALAALRLPDAQPWSASEAMAKEREAFGFYFSAHPVTEHAAVAAANGARSHAELMAMGPVAEGQRRPATMAVLVEKAQRRQSRKGSDFLQLILSDESGQFSASCFEEGAVGALVEMAERGATALAQVELDQRAGDDAPRITVRSVRPLAEAAVSARLRLEAHVETEGGMATLARLLGERRGGRGEVLLTAPTEAGGIARLRLDGGYRIDPALAGELKAMDGFGAVRVEPIRPQLALVR